MHNSTDLTAHVPDATVSMMSTRYPIPYATVHRTELVVRRSQFITSTAHSPDTASARAFIDSIRQEFSDATHNCWAFAAGAPAQTAYAGFADDGEPHGTAGRPMLTVLLHSGIGELACVVTRYFGGVKLGTGGLVRAYQGAVRENLESLPQQQRIVPARVTVSIDYAHADKVRRLLPYVEAVLEEEQYDARVTFTILLPEEHVPTLQQHIADSTNGTALFVKIQD